MFPYICLTYASADRAEAEWLMRVFAKYGFRYRGVNELTEPGTRQKHVTAASVLVALTSPAAEEARTVLSDLRRPTDRGWTPLCISLGDNGIDRRLCGGPEGPTGPSGIPSGRRAVAVRIPFPVGDPPDPHTVGQFIHRCFVNQLCRLDTAFSASRCTMDAYGRVIASAVRAHKGSMDAAYALGCAYERGEGVPVLEYQAARWIGRAADAGLVNARLHMGELRLSGWGTEPDAAEAVRLFARVAAKGDVRGEYRLGLCYLNGVGVVKDPVEAIRHLREAAQWGYSPALYRLGLLFRDGIGTPADTHAALTYFYEACRNGTEDAEETAEADETDILSGSVMPSADEAYMDGDVPMAELDGDAERETEHRRIPAPASLYRASGGRRPLCVTLRHMRRRTLRTVVEQRLVRMSTYDAPTAEQTDASTAQSFRRCRITDVRRPEADWIGGMTKPTAGDLVTTVHATAHTAVRVDRDDMAMGVPFDVSDAAVALGRLLEVGSVTEGLYPHPTRALVWYRFALRRGHSEALYRLGEAYRRGVGTPSDPEWAVNLYRMAAEWGDTRGQFALAVCCERGIGTEPDMAEAIRRYEQAAVAGYPPAQNNLGGCYEHGIGVRQNDLTAVEWYARAAAAEQPDALCRLGLCYENGRGVPADREQAFRHYEQAARRGHGYALYRLGICYNRGTYVDRPTEEETSEVVAPEMPAAEVEPALNPPLYSKAVELWRRAAALGVADAAYALAVSYAYGHGVRRDGAAAVEALRAASAAGSIQAAYRLGLCCLEGFGAVRNASRAVRQFNRAAALWRERETMYRAGDGKTLLPVDALTPMEAAGGALYMLGHCVLHGIGDSESFDIETATASSEPARIERATSLYLEAASLHHVGALTALGDLIAYGLVPPASGDTVAESEHYYIEAARVAAARRAVRSPLETVVDGVPVDKPYEDILHLRMSVTDARLGGFPSTAADDVAKSSVHALVSLATRRKDGAFAMRKEKPERAESLWAQALRLLSAAVEQGSADALILMAECVYYGHGVAQDRMAALRLLQRAARISGGRVSAELWIADFVRCGWADDVPHQEEADPIYQQALQTAPVGSESGPYIVSLRREARLAEDRAMRAEVLYRLVTFRSHHMATDPDRNDTFPYLCEAVLLHHAEARVDLARIYDYERNYNAATASLATERAKLTLVEQISGSNARRRLKKHGGAGTTLRELGSFIHRRWLCDYYTDYWLEPRPFCKKQTLESLPTKLSGHLSKEADTLMRVASLNYLGDCLFYGYGVPENTADAVACYREVVGTRLELRRGDPVPAAVYWSQYSLGWCLLHGVGVKKNAREAVKWLTMAARYHAEANFVLGACYEAGEGVDVPDDRESIKFYRKALKLGYSGAEPKVLELEKRLRVED